MKPWMKVKGDGEALVLTWRERAAVRSYDPGCFLSFRRLTDNASSPQIKTGSYGGACYSCSPGMNTKQHAFLFLFLFVTMDSLHRRTKGGVRLSCTLFTSLNTKEESRKQLRKRGV